LLISCFTTIPEDPNENEEIGEYILNKLYKSTMYLQLKFVMILVLTIPLLHMPKLTLLEPKKTFLEETKKAYEVAV